MKKGFLTVVVVITLFTAFFTPSSLATKAGERSRANRQWQEEKSIREREMAVYNQKTASIENCRTDINQNFKDISELQVQIQSLMRRINNLEKLNKTLSKKILRLEKIIREAGIQTANEPNVPDANDANDPNE